MIFAAIAYGVIALLCFRPFMRADLDRHTGCVSDGGDLLVTLFWGVIRAAAWPVTFVYETACKGDPMAVAQRIAGQPRSAKRERKNAALRARIAELERSAGVSDI
jgi:hypothetical protein